jgi:hypothetical protein
LPSKKIIRQVIGGFRTSYASTKPDREYFFRAEKCRYPPCLFADWANGIREDLRIAMCPACQAEYKAVDFDRLHAKLMDYLKHAGATLIDAL